jgi:hypothetical protein
MELHYPGHYHHDPAGASLDRLDFKKGYVRGNVIAVSLRANLLRKNASSKELQALAKFYEPFGPWDGDFDRGDNEFELSEESDDSSEPDHFESGDEFQDPGIIPDGEIMPDKVE